VLRETEIAIAGGGVAGIVTALELLDRGRRVLLIDKEPREIRRPSHSLARESFGGVHMIDTPHQRRRRWRRSRRTRAARLRSRLRLVQPDFARYLACSSKYGPTGGAHRGGSKARL